MRSTIVADTSVLVEILLAHNPDGALRRRLMTSAASAPDVVDLEFIAAYDAGFVALAEQLELPLVTCDARLAHSNGHNAQIELYPRQ